MTGTLILSDGTKFSGNSFGYQTPQAGEVVFSTGMVGYPESLTDPSYKGQILILTYPLIGNYGVPQQSLWESDNIQVSGLIVSNYNDTPSHFESRQSLSQWLINEKIPAIEIKDTRLLAQKIRTHGTMLGKIEFGDKIQFYDPSKENLIKLVSTKKVTRHQFFPKKPTVVLIDCGSKKNILRCLLKRKINVIVVPWDFNPLGENFENEKFDAILISNGPGDPKSAPETIATIKDAITKKIPILGICMGNQLLALAAGGSTYKLKFGHRSQNQPCLETGTKRCYITTQNHGYAVGRIPSGFEPWFVNANDLTNEGIRHKKLPIMSVQFHPEACPGPTDAEWIFDYFLSFVTKK